MTTYQPQEGVHIGRPPCANCGANFHLHHDAERHGSHLPDRLCLECERVGPPACPTPYRPGGLQAAADALRSAYRAGDANRVFAARGDLQRLLGHRAGTCLPLCEPCDLLLSTVPR